jgi:hypothetical protein
MMVPLAPEAQDEFDDLPPTIRARVLEVFERLGGWPEVSGPKPLSGEWSGRHVYED